MLLKIARLINMLLASVLTGNAVGSLLFVFPAFHMLSPRAKAEAEQALTRQYSPIMRFLMPITVGSCLLVLGLVRERRSASFRWTLAGTAAYIGMLGITLVELPINTQTLDVSLDTPPSDWSVTRARWEYFNRLRTLCELIGWGCLYLGSTVDSHDA